MVAEDYKNIDLTLNEEFHPEQPIQNNNILGLPWKLELRLSDIIGKKGLYPILNEFRLSDRIDRFYECYLKLFGVSPAKFIFESFDICECCGEEINVLNRVYSLCERCEVLTSPNTETFII